MSVTLLPYQGPAVEALSAAIAKHTYALDASDTGTGKTVVACAVAARLGLRPFVICPKAVIPSWKRWMDAFGLDPVDITNYEKLRTFRTKYLAKVPPNIMLWRLPKDTIVFVDEAHRAGGMDSLNGQMVGFLRGYRIPVLLMSATLAESPLKMRAPGYLLGLHTWKDYLVWLRQNGCYKDNYKRWHFTQGDAAVEAMSRIHHHIFPERGYRVSIADLGDQFPDCATFAEAYAVDDPDKINHAYLDVEMVEDLVTGGKRMMTGMEAMLRGRQAAEKAKGPILVEMAQDLIEEGNSVVVFFNFRESFATFCEKFPDCAWIRGEQSPITRQAQIDRFAMDETRVCAAMIQAGGVGVSLHDTRGQYPRVALICPTWSAVELKQAMGRIHRAGAKSKAINRIIFAAGTIEEKACEATKCKLTNMQLFNDGDLQAGLPYQLHSEGGTP